MTYHSADVREYINATQEHRSGWYSCIVVVNKEVVRKIPRLDWDTGDEGQYENIRPIAGSYEGLNREMRVYQQLPSHANLLAFYEPEYYDGKLRALVLENVTYNFWDLLWTEPKSFVPEEELRRWPTDLVSVVVHLHKHNVIHNDISSDNVMVTDGFKVKLIDFGFSSIDGDQPRGCEKPRHKLPVLLDSETRDTRPPELRDLFALGTLLYNIVAWSLTFPELSDSEVQARYSQGEFPDTTDLQHGKTIRRCWTRDYSSAQEALESLNED